MADEQNPRAKIDQRDDVVIPVIEEELVAGAKPVKTGAVRVDKHVEKRIRKIHTDLMHDEVVIRRVPVNRVVNEPPPVRKEGDLTIIPVLEEELVITKQLVLREEIHLVKRQSKEHHIKEVELDHERAEVHRVDAEGRIIDRSSPTPIRRAKPPSVLK